MELSNHDFERLSAYLNHKVGIKLPANKRTMLAGRLSKRLRALELDSLSAYCDYLFSPEGMKHEVVHLIDAITTNKTDFFREPIHFEYLRDNVLPRMVGKGKRHLRVWSAACSTGEEPYTLAMILAEYQRQVPGFSFEVLATDICTKVLETARQGTYSLESVAPVPLALRKRYLLRGKGEFQDQVRIAPEAQDRVCFGRLNFMAADYKLPSRQQIIFCRNVLIYFDHPTQEQVINKLCRYLEPDGYLFLGHSESIMGYQVPLTQEAPTIHRRLGGIGKA